MNPSTPTAPTLTPAQSAAKRLFDHAPDYQDDAARIIAEEYRPLLEQAIALLAESTLCGRPDDEQGLVKEWQVWNRDLAAYEKRSESVTAALTRALEEKP